MDVKIVILESTNPYINIAREYCYYNDLKEDQLYFLLWQNEPSFIMGRNQNIYSEVNLEYIKQKNILPVRRFTGGGCVYHDLGNLNFTFISRNKDKDMDAWMNIIIKALEQEGVKTELKGRNDLLANGKKISGMAWLEDEDKFLIHGTLMVDLDIDVLSKCLTPNISKFVGKGIKSVKSRVINLKELSSNISMNSLKKSLVKAFVEVYPQAEKVSHIKHEEEGHVFRMLESQEWIFGKREKAQIQRSFTINEKPINIDLYIENDIITDINIYSDSLDLKKIDQVKFNLLGRKYKDIYIEDILKSIFI